MATNKTTQSKKKTTQKNNRKLNEAKKKTAKRAEEPEVNEESASRVKDIVMLIVIAFCVMAYVAVFSTAIPWMTTACDFLFGNMKYVAPLILLVLVMIFLYHEKNKDFARRLIAFILLVFAVSGLLAYIGGAPEKGGLLGRLNYLFFHSWLDKVGSIIVNVLLIAISIVLFIDFSVFTYIREKSDPNSEENKERMKRYEDKKEEKRLMRENKALEEDQNRQKSIEEYRERNKRLQEQNEAREARQRENEERFKPIHGIGDTTIVDDDGDEALTTFKYDEDDTKIANENAELFGKYTNSGVKTEEEEDDSFIPKINFGNEMFKDENSSVIPESDELNAEDGETDTGLLTGDDDYQIIKVTGNGKILHVPSNGQHVSPVNTDFTKEFEAEEADTKPAGKLDAPVVPKETEKEYKFPPIRLLQKGVGNGLSKSDIEKELQENAEKLTRTLKTFGIGVTVTDITCGPSVTRYEIQPEVGVKVSRITALTDDIKMNLAAKDIRMEAPIPGKSAIGIEVPNRAKTGVYIRDLLESDEFKNSKSKLAFTLGRDIEGNTIVSDIAKMPHVLIAGTTGSGKSVCLNTMIMSIIYHAKPTEVKMLMVDPKMVEMQVYNGLPHLLLPVITDPKKASLALNWACTEMDKRYEKFAKYCVRGIEGYNQFCEMEKTDENGEPLHQMPQIVIFVDEMSDMMMVARKEVEDSIIRLAQKARAAGIHLVLATQSPRAEVLTGLIKANVPSRIALSVSSGLESRIIIDQNGAENLLGHGDMLYLPSGANKPNRIQGAFVSDDEISKVMEYIKNQKDVKGGGIATDINLESDNGSAATAGGKSNSDIDELFEACGRFIIDNEKASIGQLQRKFSIGFNRAARIMDQLCDYKVVGEEEGTKPRRILMSMVQFNELLKELDA